MRPRPARALAWPPRLLCGRNELRPSRPVAAYVAWTLAALGVAARLNRKQLPQPTTTFQIRASLRKLLTVVAVV